MRARLTKRAGSFFTGSRFARRPTRPSSIRQQPDTLTDLAGEPLVDVRVRPASKGAILPNGGNGGLGKAAPAIDDGRFRRRCPFHARELRERYRQDRELGFAETLFRRTGNLYRGAERHP